MKGVDPRFINEAPRLVPLFVPALRFVHCLFMKKHLTVLLVASCVTVASQLVAQEGTPGSYQNPSGTPDCSDPLLANSSQCAALQGQNQIPLSSNGPVQSGQTGSQGPLNFNYTDNENLGRQTTSRTPSQPQPIPPPELLTEFQKFVVSSTGQVLPIYGANLFRQVPSTFAPVDLAPVPPDYVIGPGDELRIRVWGQVNFRADVRVDRSGEVYLPQIGQVHVAGMPFSQLDAHLRSEIARVYRNFDLTVDVGQIRAIQVYLAGEARRPGVYTVSSLSTLVDTLFAAGGPSATGSFRHVELRRAGAQITDFDLYSLLVHGDKSKDVALQSGDVLFIPPSGPQVAITGSVKDPAIYELRAGETIGDLLSDAGGASVVAAQARISVERIDQHRDRFAMEVAWDQAGLATSLDDGDLIRVYSIVPMYQKTVMLRGNTANQGRFAWHPGMHISDLIPDKESLITRNYWWKRAALGFPAPEFEPLQVFSNLRQPSNAVELPRTRLIEPPANNGLPGNQAATGGTEMSLSPQSLNDQSYSQPVPGYGSNPPAMSGQTGVPGSMSQTPSAAQRASSASLAAGQSDYSSTPPPAYRTEVGPVAPDIDWDYAVVERLDAATLKTVLIPFDLGRLVIQHDAAQDLALQPGDIVSIFSQGDIRVPVAQQTKFVRLDGEFVHSGVYTVQPGETLHDLVQRAGGLTANAYLYGSEFTRESVRAIQQRRMDEYVETLAMQMQRGNLDLAASPVSSTQDLASGAAAQTSEQELIGRLRQMRATGRIVLEFKAGSSGLDVLPDIALEGGDRFVVPPMPASINVVGAVYDQNSFLFETTRRAGTYLHLAGGPNRDADTRHIFIIRADGSVISREAENGIWGNEFDNLRMNPGDTIVVPEKIFKPSALRGFLDWSQLFSQFAFGAAALSVIE